MTVTFALVESTPYRLRYLATSGGEVLGGTGTIPNDGGATPDLLTDLTASFENLHALRACVRARLDGYGTIGSGTPLTQAQARALFLSDNTVSVGNNTLMRAVTTVTTRTGTASWSVDANVDGQGDPVVAVTASVAAGDAYVDIHCRYSRWY